MQTQTALILDDKEIEALKRLTDLVPIFEKALSALTEMSKPAKEEDKNPWLKSPDFCKKWGISAGTLYKRVSEGRIEVNPITVNDKIKMYRYVDSILV